MTNVKGFTLLETLTAIFVMTVAIAGIFVLISRVTATSSGSFDRLTAAYLAQEGIEIVRNIRDSNWLSGLPLDQGLTGCSTGCEADSNDQALSLFSNRFLGLNNGFYTYTYSPGQETAFKRKIIIVPTLEVLAVTVEVSWEGKQMSVTKRLYPWLP